MDGQEWIYLLAMFFQLSSLMLFWFWCFYGSWQLLVAFGLMALACFIKGLLWQVEYYEGGKK